MVLQLADGCSGWLRCVIDGGFFRLPCAFELGELPCIPMNVVDNDNLGSPLRRWTPPPQRYWTGREGQALTNKHYVDFHAHCTSTWNGRGSSWTTARQLGYRYDYNYLDTGHILSTADG